MYGGYQNYNQGASAPPYQGAPQHQQYNPYGSQHPPPNYQGYQQHNPYQQQQPPPPAAHRHPPPPTQQPDLWGWFCAVDTDRSGRISCNELQQALSNGFEKFNMQTVQMLMNLFDASNSGQMVFDDFRKVFDFISQWSRIFQQYDTDRSGAISFTEIKTALTNFGYRLSDRFYNIICSRFANQKRNNEITFDNFIRICVVLNNVTKNFQSLDTNRSGVIQISYEQFVEILFSIV
ncbi:programmed cell death protein 6-like [Convolutriloba macropyga]|uniref:programmed cell death protein 6-like n=1 Tax=Convolutriloba macropyga TaxID=536237 RepID=UPI003F5242BD